MIGKHILVADDDTFIQQALKFMLTSLKADFTILTNGQDCFNTYTDKKSSVNLILMDLQMPILDGYQATQKIRDFEKSNGIAAVKIFGLSGGNLIFLILIILLKTMEMI